MILRQGGLGGPSGACRRFYDCVGLRVDCRPGFSDPITGFSQEECSVNGGEYAFTGSGICASPTTTAGRFGVPWGKAQTEWNNAKAGRACGYDLADTIQTGTGEEGGAPGGVRARTRGSAQTPNQPLSGRLLFDTLRDKCGIPWGANFSNLTSEQNACLTRVKNDFRRRGYNSESIACKGASGEGMLECTPVFIPQEDRGDFRRDTSVDSGGPSTTVGSDVTTISTPTNDTEYVYDGPDARVTVDDVTSPPTPGPGVSPINCGDSYNSGHPCCSDTGRDLAMCHIVGVPTQTGPVGHPGTILGTAYSEPGFSAFGQDGGGFFDGLTEGDEWIEGVPNLATLAVGAIGGLFLFRELRLLAR